jgi:hypothetical protein
MSGADDEEPATLLPPRCGRFFFGSFLITAAEVISGCDTGIRKITEPPVDLGKRDAETADVRQRRKPEETRRNPTQGIVS